MKKQVTIKVVESNAAPLKAMAIAKANSSIGCKNFVDNVFKIKEYVFTKSTITTIETGEVEEMECISLLTDQGEILGTNSKTVMNSFRELLDLCNDNAIDFTTVDVVITSGTSKSGNTFYSLEVKI